MKVAICFSGQLRNVSSTYEQTLKSNILDANSEHQIDFFVHSWFDRNTTGKIYYASNEIPDSVAACNPIPDDVVQQMYNIYNPISVEMQHPKQFDEKDYNHRRLNGANPQNGLSRLYSLYRSVKLKSEHEIENNFIYDAVVCTRFDLGFVESFNFNLITKNGIYHPGYSPHGFNVCYAMGDSASVDTYSFLYHNVNAVFNTGIYWCDENLAKRYLEICNMPVYDFHKQTRINRGS